jgi:hypothetical protein
MKRIIEKSLAAALLVGFFVGFVNYVASFHSATRYDPPLSEEEYRKVRELPIEKAEAVLAPRTRKLTRTQWVMESIGDSWFWWDVAKHSVVPTLGVFVACVCVGVLLRRNGSAQ